jgi:RimJ/RimL family protein N-acetyltransferase
MRFQPDVFGAAFDVEASKDDSFWKGRLSDSYKGAAFGLYDGDLLIGLTGIYRHYDRMEDTAMLCMSYIREEYRGKGLSDLLYRARIDWAKAQGDIRTLVVGHREGNEASRRANQQWGFILTSIEDDYKFGNGDTAKHYTYELKI